jgi:hypothetical protein
MHFPLMPDHWRLPVALTALIGCTGALLARPTAPTSLGEALRVAAKSGGARHARAAAHDYDAHLVVRLDDCDGNVHALRFLRRSAVRERVHFADVLLVGSESDLVAARRRLGDAPDGTPIRRADDRTTSALRALGFRATPFVVIADHSGALKMALQLPASVEEMAAFARLLPHLAPPALAARSPG